MLAARSSDSHADIQSPDARDVGIYLRELLAQTAFTASGRNRRFLSYVVTETLEGRADRIKAYNIALAAFDRAADFDPLTDPIVRIEASRLRRSLEHYYLTAGKTDRIRIDIPKGSYAATFTYGSGAQETPRPKPDEVSRAPSVVLPRAVPPKRYTSPRVAATMTVLALILGAVLSFGVVRYTGEGKRSPEASDRPSLVIVPFEDTGGDAKHSFVARGLTYDVGTALAQLNDVAVFGRGPGFGNSSQGSEPVPEFSLVGSVQCDGHSMRVTVLLMDSRTGQFLHSWSYEKDAKDIINAQAEVAQQILESVKRNCTRVEASGSSAAPPGMSFDCRRAMPAGDGLPGAHPKA